MKSALGETMLAIGRRQQIGNGTLFVEAMTVTVMWSGRAANAGASPRAGLRQGYQRILWFNEGGRYDEEGLQSAGPIAEDRSLAAAGRLG